MNEMEATAQRKTLTMEDRKVLAEMWAAGERAAVIAVKAGRVPRYRVQGIEARIHRDAERVKPAGL